MTARAFAGRPRKNDDFQIYDGDLYKLLVTKLPSEFIKTTKVGQSAAEHRIDTQRLCEATGNARYTVYRWLSRQVLSRKAIISLLELSEGASEREKRGALTKKDLIPFLGL